MSKKEGERNPKPILPKPIKSPIGYFRPKSKCSASGSCWLLFPPKPSPLYKTNSISFFLSQTLNYAKLQTSSYNYAKLFFRQM